MSSSLETSLKNEIESEKDKYRIEREDMNRQIELKVHTTHQKNNHTLFL